MSMPLPVVSRSLERYLHEINKFPLLSAEEEQALARAWKDEQNLEAAHKLTTSNLRFVVKIAYEYRRYGIRLADLIQEGNIGLMMAVKKFDPDRGFRLISYAVWWIRAQIQNFILQSWRLVKLGTTQAQRRLFYKLEKTKRALAWMNGGGDETLERRLVAKALNVKEEVVAEMEQRLGFQELSLESRLPTENEGGRTLEEILADSQPDQEELVGEAQYHEHRQRHLYRALGKLSDRERLILENRLLVEDPQTLNQIGQHLGITRERVRQLEARALRKLRTHLLQDGMLSEAV